MNIKEIAKSILETSGYALHKIPTEEPIGKDLYTDLMRVTDTNSVSSVFDVGANVGKISLKYHSLFPNAKIHAFEPAKKIFYELENNCRNISRVHLYPLALADSTGKRTFYEYGSNLNNSFLKPSSQIEHHYTDKSMITPTSVSEVTTITLDDFCKENKIAQIDILKLDIQGAELTALKGAKNILSQSKIGIIHSEVFFKELYDNQCYFFDQYAYLAGFGYQLFGLYNYYYRENEGLQLADALFISPELFRMRSQLA